MKKAKHLVSIEVAVFGLLFGLTIIIWTCTLIYTLGNVGTDDARGHHKLRHNTRIGGHLVYLDEADDPSSKGYGGKGVQLDPTKMNSDDLIKYKTGYLRHHFNEMASDMIPLTRKILNVTEPECLEVEYDYKHLPTAGVVIIFHNEAWSVLLRSVHSILRTVPRELLKEIILVDDASTIDGLHQQVKEYVSIFSNVMLVGLKKRSGLMVARMEGLKHVTGDVVVFLDSHVEMPQRWLEPLLLRIQSNPKILAVPATDSIDQDDFSYQAISAKDQNIGGFDLDLYYTWLPQRKDKNTEFDILKPIRSPTHLGCCFAMSVDTFKHLGQYDPQLKIWGCENIELSFKVWMCGGHIEIIPCSRVGHLFRQTAPYGYGDEDAFDVIKHNCVRVAEVWMDDYKYFYYNRIFNTQKTVAITDLSEQKLLRNQLQCKSFKWYLDNAFPDIHLPFDWLASGQISNVAYPNKCIETPVHWANYGKSIYIEECNKQILIQHFTLTKENQIRRDEGCLNIDGDRKLVVTPCTEINNEGWIYRKDRSILHKFSGKCLGILQDGSHVDVIVCNGGIDQKWNWDRTIPTKIKNLSQRHNFK